MVAALPELSAAHEDFLEFWGPGDPPGAINFTDNVLVPFVEELLEDEERGEVLRRAFAFIEELASDPGADIREAAQVAVNCLTPNKKFLAATYLMGPKMQEMVRISAEDFG